MNSEQVIDDIFALVDRLTDEHMARLGKMSPINEMLIRSAFRCGCIRTLRYIAEKEKDRGNI